MHTKNLLLEINIWYSHNICVTHMVLHNTILKLLFWIPIVLFLFEVNFTNGESRNQKRGIVSKKKKRSSTILIVGTLLTVQIHSSLREVVFTLSPKPNLPLDPPLNFTIINRVISNLHVYAPVYIYMYTPF